jgi:tRNA (guanine-N7-)-methyltransferase
VTTELQKGNTVKSVNSNQFAIHDKLAATVDKHLHSQFKKPYSTHSEQAIGTAKQWLHEQNRPFILDSFCGTGESTRALARQYPQYAVLGVDKSADRLERHQQADADNYLLLRADTDDLWRLLLEAHCLPEKHCIFYPNPWPKSEHLKRRCHGSPLFPTLLALGGRLELRSNWPIYAEEFCAALKIANIDSQVSEFAANPAITAFERKYSEAGQTLWRVRCQLPSPPPTPL